MFHSFRPTDAGGTSDYTSGAGRGDAPAVQVSVVVEPSHDAAAVTPVANGRGCAMVERARARLAFAQLPRARRLVDQRSVRRDRLVQPQSRRFRR